jgi:hypothetical protein
LLDGKEGVDGRPAAARTQHARWIFLDPATRELYVDWPVVARENVAILRHDVAQHPDDPQLRELIGELSMASPEFRTWWAEHDVATRNSGTKRYRHPLRDEPRGDRGRARPTNTPRSASYLDTDSELCRRAF